MVTVLASDRSFVEFIFDRVAPAMGAPKRSVLARDLERAFRQGYLRRSKLDLAELGINPKRATDVCMAVLCACTGQPLIVCTRLGAIGMPRHVRLDVYFFDPISISSPGASGVYQATRTSPPRQREDACFDGLLALYRNAARNGSGVDVAPRSKTAPADGSCVAGGIVQLQWRRILLPILAEGKLGELRPSLRKLLSTTRNEAMVAMLLQL